MSEDTSRTPQATDGKDKHWRGEKRRCDENPKDLRKVAAIQRLSSHIHEQEKKDENREVEVILRIHRFYGWYRQTQESSY